MKTNTSVKLISTNGTVHCYILQIPRNQQQAIHRNLKKSKSLKNNEKSKVLLFLVIFFLFPNGDSLRIETCNNAGGHIFELC